MANKEITLTTEEIDEIKRKAYREGMQTAMERFNSQNTIYITIGKAIEQLIFEKAEPKREDY